MTKADRELLQLVNRRVASLQPDLARALRAYYRILADEIGASQVVALIKAGRIDDIINEEVLERATIPIRQGIRESMERGFRVTVPDVASLVRKPLAELRAQIFFDVISPRIVTAIRTMESTSVHTLREEVRATVRQVTERGLTNGLHPTAIARDLRETIGIPPNVERYIYNAEQDLRTLNPRYLTRALRDKRFDATVKRAIETGTPLTEAQIEKAVSGYRRKHVKNNAEVNTLQLSLDSYREARREAYMSAVDRGIIDRDRAQKTVICFDYPDPSQARPEHRQYNGLTIPIEQDWPNGDKIFGKGAWRCKCQERYSMRLRTPAAA